MQRRHLIASAALLASAPHSWAATPWQTALTRAQAMRDVAVRSGDQAYGAVVVDAQGRLVAEHVPDRAAEARDEGRSVGSLHRVNDHAVDDLVAEAGHSLAQALEQRQHLGAGRLEAFLVAALAAG